MECDLPVIFIFLAAYFGSFWGTFTGLIVVVVYLTKIIEKR